MTDTKGAARPLQVVHLTWGLDVGGLEKLLVEFARHADRRRVELRFVSLGGRGVLADAIEECGWPVTALDEPEGLRRALVFRLAALFREWRPDVVHTHNTKALVYGGPAARLARIRRLVHTWHGQNPTGSKRETLLFKLLGRLPDDVVAVSRDAARWLVEAGIPVRKVRTIWNGVDTRRFSYNGARVDGPIVTVARLSPEKDIATLIRAMGLLQDQPDLRLEIAGDGQCRADLEALTRQLQLQDRVQFLGQRKDIPALLERASLFVLPSLTEGISLTLLEASASGLPVVATRVGGNPEIVEDGVTGLLVPAASPAELASAIRTLYGNARQRQQMGYEGRQRIEREFDICRMVMAYEDLYLGKNAPRSSIARGMGPPKPKVLTNMRKVPAQSGLVRGEHLPSLEGSFRKALTFWWKSGGKDAILLDQEYRVLLGLCILRMLNPIARPPLVSLDLILSRPGPGFLANLKALVKRLVFSQVDLFLMHLKDKHALQEVYGIPPRKVRYVPFKVNFLEHLPAQPPPEGDYIFTGGRSRRDYKTFCEAMALVGYPGQIVTPPPEVNALHGTDLGGVTPPTNVRLVHDDGSMASWVEKIANCKIAVFTISPETISPSGVGAYLLAMALKKCVIISDCPSTRDILIDGENALLVPMRDPARLADVLRRVWDDDALRRKVAEGGYQYAMSLGGEETLARNAAQEVVSFLQQRRQRGTA